MVEEQLNAKRMAGFEQTQPRDMRTGRSSLVKFLKLALPLSAAAIALTLFLWPFVQNQMIADLAAPVEVSEPELIRAQTENRLLEATFSSVTSDGLPFNVNAVEAVQNLSNPDRIDMVKPTAMLTLDGGDTLNLKSETGVLEQENGDLLLEGQVTLSHDDGTQLTTNSVTANLKEGTARSTNIVRVEGPNGIIDAQGLSVSDAGNTIIFVGPARLELVTDGDAMSLSSQGG